MSSDDRIEILGGIIVSSTGLHIAGELGINKDIQIVAAMFSAVEGFVSDTFGCKADQIRLSGDMFITRMNGKYATIWMTSIGTSEQLLDGARKVLADFETKHGNRLEGWNGVIEPQFEHDLNGSLRALRAEVMTVSKEASVPSPGFSLLSSADPSQYIGGIEDAFDLYFLIGDLNSACQLATQAARALEERDPGTKDSSLFHALALKVMVLQKKDEPAMLGLLGDALALSKTQDNKLAEAEVCDAYANYYILKTKTCEARAWSQRAIDTMESHGIGSLSDQFRLINVKNTNTQTFFFAGEHDAAIERWKEGLRTMKRLDKAGTSDLERILIAKHNVALNNNIGFTLTLKDKLDPQSYREALPYLTEAKRYLDENGARWFIPVIYGNLGSAYAFTGDLDKASVLIDRSYDHAKQTKLDYRIALGERNWGIFHYRKGILSDNVNDLFEAMHWFNLAMKNQTSPNEREYIKFFYDTCRTEIAKRI